MGREDILEAALRVYLKNPKATVHEIAEEAGVSKSTIFYYFKNKGNLQKELLLYAIRKFSPWDSSIEDAVRRWLRSTVENPGLTRLFYTLFDDLSKSDPEFVRDVCERSFRRIAELLEREGFKNSKDLATLLLAILDGLSLYAIYIDLDVTKYEDTILKILGRMRDEV